MSHLILRSGQSSQMFFHLLSRFFIACCRASNSVCVGQASVSWSRTSHRFRTELTPALWCSMSRWISWNKERGYPWSFAAVTRDQVPSTCCLKTYWRVFQLNMADICFVLSSKQKYFFYFYLGASYPFTCFPATGLLVCLKQHAQALVSQLW